MVEYLLKEKDKAEKAAIYHAEQYQRAEVKLEVINEMIQEVKKAETDKEPVETETVDNFADGEVVDTVETAVE